ncbi:hypothetical protein ABIF26_002467 [Bradyrhizobium elkanii]
MTTGSTVPLRDRSSVRSAKAMQPVTRITSPRLVRSARKPPNGTERAASQSTILMVDPAAAPDQPCSTSIDGPKLKIIAKPML